MYITPDGTDDYDVEKRRTLTISLWVWIHPFIDDLFGVYLTAAHHHTIERQASIIHSTYVLWACARAHWVYLLYNLWMITVQSITMVWFDFIRGPCVYFSVVLRAKKRPVWKWKTIESIGNEFDDKIQYFISRTQAHNTVCAHTVWCLDQNPNH